MFDRKGVVSVKATLETVCGGCIIGDTVDITKVEYCARVSIPLVSSLTVGFVRIGWVGGKKGGQRLPGGRSRK